MIVDKLKQRIEELPKGLIVTKVHIETLNRHGEPLTIEYEKDVDEIRQIRQTSNKSMISKFWRKNKNV